MNIWIDLANSPQVLFFRPLIPRLEEDGYKITITTRRFSQTTELADHFGIPHTSIGGHGGKRISKIGMAILDRAWKLIRFAKGRKFDLAISHNSYAQALAAKALRIPFVTSMDYEHQPANHFCFRLARRVVVPVFFPEASLRSFGAHTKAARYQGTKEEIYLADFQPTPDYLSTVGIPPDRIVAVMRPPGSWGLYHNFENPLFERALEHVAQAPGTFVVFLPRVPFQSDAVKAMHYPNIYIPDHALDGPHLMYHADLVISGGGSMNREAAVLGTPTYSLFKGKLAAVDRYLIDRGRMHHIDNSDRIPSIPVQKKKGLGKTDGSPDLVREVAQLLTTLDA